MTVPLNRPITNFYNNDDVNIISAAGLRYTKTKGLI